jgi:sulfate permease, SulP family
MRLQSSRTRLSSVLLRDLVAGTTVAFVLIPQALAYASVAGMPPISGIYAAALPPIAASLLASSPYLQTGPVALTSLLTLGALAAMAPLGSQEYVQLGIMLALLVGVFRVLLGVTRTGVIAHLMSEPMLMGFVPAGAILIVCSQLPSALGDPEPGGDVIGTAVSTLASPATWASSAIAIALLTLTVILAGRRIHPLFPGVLVALVAGLVVGSVTSFGGALVGPVPSGLPRISLDLPWSSMPSLLVPAAVIAVVGFAEPASIARTYATRERQPWSADREFVSQGVGNLVSAVSGGYPIGGSLSRSSLNHQAGAATRASGAVTGLVVLAFVPFASVLASLPKAILAAIVISSVLGLLRFGRLLRLWRVSRPQFAVATVTFALVLLLAPHVERAVIAGVVLSIVIHLARELRLQVDISLRGETLEIRPAGVLWFGNAQRLEDRLIAVLDAHPGVSHVRIRLGGLGRVDVTGAMALHNLLADAAGAGLSLELTDVPTQVQPMLARLARHREGLL